MNYASHHFATARLGGDPGAPPEFVRYCSECGCLDRGDPAEFPELEYPACETMVP
jgi:hypothetical protein